MAVGPGASASMSISLSISCLQEMAECAGASVRGTTAKERQHDAMPMLPRWQQLRAGRPMEIIPDVQPHSVEC